MKWPVRSFIQASQKNQSRDIENIKKKALKINLGEHYGNYELACTLMSAEPLSDRRDAICLTFIKKAVKKGFHTDIFKPARTLNFTRSKKSISRRALEPLQIQF